MLGKKIGDLKTLGTSISYFEDFVPIYITKEMNTNLRIALWFQWSVRWGCSALSISEVFLGKESCDVDRYGAEWIRNFRK